MAILAANPQSGELHVVAIQRDDNPRIAFLVCGKYQGVAESPEKDLRLALSAKSAKK